MGLYYLSPTYASAIQNAIPAITFAMAAALRYPKQFMQLQLIQNTDSSLRFCAKIIHHHLPNIYTQKRSWRLEEVNLKERYGVAKVAGTVVSVGGATIITLYKGLPLLSNQPGPTNLTSTQILNWTLGCLYILSHITAWSAWIVLQVISRSLNIIYVSMLYSHLFIASKYN